MGKPVNLNRFKKQKTRAEKTARADQNAALHGLPKSERELAKARGTLEAKRLSNIKRDTKDLT